jgi:cytochrome-b5 reductase
MRATDQIHYSIDYEFMLKECLIGQMCMKPAVPKDYHEGK